jgi:Lantibiotic dehydratase, N terminus
MTGEHTLFERTDAAPETDAATRTAATRTAATRSAATRTAAGAPTAAAAPGSANTAPGFSPYVLFRRGTLGLAALSGMVPERTWSLLDQAEQAAHRAGVLGGPLEHALYEAVPLLPAEHRRALLAVRRGVHNGRPPQLPPAVELLPGPCRELLDQWAAESATAHRLLAEAEATLPLELDAARKTLADIALDEDFRRGVQLSGEDAYRTLMAYAADPSGGQRKPSRRRRAESTIVSFAYRVAFKPSPFGSFTEIGAQPWAGGAPDGKGRVARTRLNVGLLAWMAHQLRRIDGADRLLRLRLNNSLTVRGDRALYVRRPPDGADAAFDRDRVISARHTGLLRLLTGLLGDGDRTEADLRTRLTEAGLAPEAAATTIDQLVTAGILHRDLGLPDQTTRFAAAAARLLRETGTGQATRCAAVFERLQAIEDGYATAPAATRTGLLAELRTLVDEFVETTGCRPPGGEAMRAVIYEDVGTRAPACSWQPELLAANRGHLALFQRVVPVLDDASTERLGLYRFFADRYGEDARDVPLTELYRAFAELTPQEASAVVSGVGDPHCDEARRLRESFLDLVRDHPEPAPGEPLVLDPERLRAFADRLPPTLPGWRSTAYRVQFGGPPQQPCVVVNGVTTGHGVFYSRFCELLEPEEPGAWSLREAVRGHIARTWPRQTDLTAVLGLNFNLHPRLSPLELVYPGSVPQDPRAGAVTLAGVTVRPDPQARRLELAGPDGQPLDLVPLNFLYPAAAPALYRFLCAFAPTRTYRGGLWEQVHRAGPPAAHRPRVVLGDLVLDRASWRFPVADLPDLAGLERQETAALAAFDRWRRAAGVPRHGFFRVLTPPPAAAPGERDVLEEVRRWALEARSARLHKPHFYDARNPFLLYVLAKQAAATPGGAVLFQECLPEVAAYGSPEGPASAEEFFVEFTGGGA